MANEEIRALMRMYHIPQWKLAKEGLGCCEATVQRMLRTELPKTKQNEIIKIIKELKGDR